MSETEYKYLELNSRMYQYIKSTTITSLDDALVELITNCIDAYNTSDSINNSIKIILSKNNKTLEVIDQAIGIDSTNMETCFLTVGTYTSTQTNRGHFARGAKDISSLGDITFTAIKDGKYSQCKILVDGRGAMLVSDQNVTEEIREYTQISNNGLHVKLDIQFETTITEFNLEDLPYHYALRDILSDERNIIEYTDLDAMNTNSITYSYPEHEKVVEVEYLVPYYGVPAKFTCYLSRDKDIKYSSNSRYNENSFLISSNTTIYENAHLHNGHIFRNPHSVKLYGRVECDHINNLLKDYEENGARQKNPYPIIEPTRLHGLSKNHPFIKHMLRLPVERVLYILSELEYESKKVVNNNKLNEIFGSLIDLQSLGNEIFNKLDIDLISDFQLDHMLNMRLNQKFVKENENLRFSKRKVSNRKKSIKEKAQDSLNNAARLSIDFVDETINGKYEAYATNKGINIKIPMSHSVIKRYLNKNDDEIKGMDDTRVRIAIADIITEAFSKIMTDNELTDIDITDMDKNEIFNLMTDTYNEYYNIYEEKIYDILLNGE
jgi:hypothetical protein